jgi:hypothetical protein
MMKSVVVMMNLEFELDHKMGEGERKKGKEESFAWLDRTC